MHIIVTMPSDESTESALEDDSLKRGEYCHRALAPELCPMVMSWRERWEETSPALGDKLNVLTNWVNLLRMSLVISVLVSKQFPK